MSRVHILGQKGFGIQIQFLETACIFRPPDFASRLSNLLILSYPAILWIQIPERAWYHSLTNSPCSPQHLTKCLAHSGCKYNLLWGWLFSLTLCFSRVKSCLDILGCCPIWQFSAFVSFIIFLTIPLARPQRSLPWAMRGTPVCGSIWNVWDNPGKNDPSISEGSPWEASGHPAALAEWAPSARSPAPFF